MTFPKFKIEEQQIILEYAVINLYKSPQSSTYHFSKGLHLLSNWT